MDLAKIVQTRSQFNYSKNIYVSIFMRYIELHSKNTVPNSIKLLLLTSFCDLIVSYSVLYVLIWMLVASCCRKRAIIDIR